MKTVFIVAILGALTANAAHAKGFHDEIPEVFRGTGAETLPMCRDPDGVDTVFVDAESVNYYEGNDYLLLGIDFGGSMTKPGGSGKLFNGRFTSRMETKILGEHNIRMEIDDDDRNVMYRYPIGDDGEPILAREVTEIRCPVK